MGKFAEAGRRLNEANRRINSANMVLERVDRAATTNPFNERLRKFRVP